MIHIFEKLYLPLFILPLIGMWTYLSYLAVRYGDDPVLDILKRIEADNEIQIDLLNQINSKL